MLRIHSGKMKFKSGQTDCLRIQRLKFESKGRMFIDRATAQHLELVRNLRSGTGSNSLFEIINFTKTVSIYQSPTSTHDLFSLLESRS